MAILVTGAAGFIGAALCEKLLARGDEVIGLDNLNAYYDVTLKYSRLNRLSKWDNFRFYKVDIADSRSLQRLFKTTKPKKVINLAAQAGVRYSLTHPEVYIESNIKAFLNILEGCRHSKVESLTYASSSSVYGLNGALPLSTKASASHPVSLYGATKRANELMAHSYSHLYGLPTTGLRFFSVYGPWGRPDMALFIFTKAILEGNPIDVFNHGNHLRDFTFIDDIVTAITLVLDNPAIPNKQWDNKLGDTSSSLAPYKIYNIGNNNPVTLSELISNLELCLGKKAKKNYLPMQPGDVPETFANISDLKEEFGFMPKTSIKDGIKKFVDWYLNYYADGSKNHLIQSEALLNMSRFHLNEIPSAHT